MGRRETFGTATTTVATVDPPVEALAGLETVMKRARYRLGTIQAAHKPACGLPSAFADTSVREAVERVQRSLGRCHELQSLHGETCRELARLRSADEFALDSVTEQTSRLSAIGEAAEREIAKLDDELTALDGAIQSAQRDNQQAAYKVLMKQVGQLSDLVTKCIEIQAEMNNLLAEAPHAGVCGYQLNPFGVDVKRFLQVQEILQSQTSYFGPILES